MKKLCLCLALLLLGISTVMGQGDDTVRLQVVVDSAFIRAEPAPDAAPVASVTEGAFLEAVGRNADGLWYEVRRPGGRANLGWIFYKMVNNNFEIERLPLTNSSTGLTGATPISDNGWAAFLLVESNLRAVPSAEGERLAIIPIGVTLPVIGRDQDASWLQVNYLGTVGWVSGLNMRVSVDPLTLPQGTGLLDRPTINVLIVPPEVQLAQVQRLRDYILQHQDMATNLENFWGQVMRGEIMPCNPPDNIAQYAYTLQDVRELPELKRYVTRIDVAVEKVNASVDALQPCGAVDRSIAQQAGIDATNAKIILKNNLQQLEYLERFTIK